MKKIIGGFSTEEQIAALSRGAGVSSSDTIRTVISSDSSITVNTSISHTTDSTALGDGTNLLSTFRDLDTGGGSEFVFPVNLRLSGSGGTVEAGTASDPFRIDPTGSTTQPVSAAALPLPAGASTSAAQSTGNASLATIAGDTTSLDAKVPAQGAAVTASSTPVNIASDQTVPVSAASLPLPAGAATEATLASIDGNILPNLIDSNNSTTTPLGSGATFTGTGTDVSGRNSVSVIFTADQDSAADGMQIQFSSDNTNWDDISSFNMDISSASTRRFQFPVVAQYFRVVYTNGAVAQGLFRVQSIVHVSTLITTIHRVDDSIIGDRSVLLTKTVIAGETTAGGGAFVNVKVAPSGALQADVEQATHDDLNANVNLQVGDTDVANGNPVPVSDAGGSLTVDNSGLTALDGAISGTEVQVDIVAPLPTGTNTIGAMNLNRLSVVDLIDDLGDGAGIVFAANDNIDDSAGTFLTLVASTAAAVQAIQVIDTTGGYIGLYTGPGASEVLVAVLGPGSDQTLELSIASSTRVSVRRMDSATVPLTAGFLSINFLG